MDPPVDYHSDNNSNSDAEEFHELVIPDSGVHPKPFIGQIFDNLNAATDFYYSYASSCGFKARKSTLVKANDETVKTRYLLCSREGFREDVSDEFVLRDNDCKQKRRRLSSRIDCKARIVFTLVGASQYKVHIFVEGHCHNMTLNDCRHLMTSNRNVDEGHQLFIMSSLKVNIGPMKAFRLFSELSGGDEYVGCTKIDFKNYARDLRVAIHGVDAHVLLQNFRKKQEHSPGFKFFYDLDETNKLNRLFWADEKSLKNFSFFGDAVALDATYGTNRYRMIFTPFTGKDNHGCCVTLGAALISREDVESYSWVLERFVECMGTHPNVLTTDHDPALRKAVAAVLPNTSHRFCMWHITMKVAEKLPVNLRDDSDFRKRFNKIIWSDFDEIQDFEESWVTLINEYGLADHRWFRDLYGDRHFWIPAFFRDVRMSGLFRTTSMSESENSFFRTFFNRNADLVRMFMHYCTAMESQRTSFKTITMSDENGSLDFMTDLPIKRHASSLYTTKIFKEVQEEIVAASKVCIMAKMYSEAGVNFYHVDDIVDGIFHVRHEIIDDYISCTCKLFTRKGLLCRHMFYVMRNLKLRKILEKYIVRRWLKWSHSCPTSGSCQNQELVPVNSNSGVGNNYCFVYFAKCMAAIHGKDDLCEGLQSDMLKLVEKYVALGLPNTSEEEKNLLFEQFYGGPIPETPQIGSPSVSNTKGCGVGGRRLSAREKAIKLSQKRLRNCSKCNRLVRHDARTCLGDPNQE